MMDRQSEVEEVKDEARQEGLVMTVLEEVLLLRTDDSFVPDCARSGGGFLIFFSSLFSSGSLSCQKNTRCSGVGA
jgi:hypothetical protein